MGVWKAVGVAVEQGAEFHMFSNVITVLSVTGV